MRRFSKHAGLFLLLTVLTAVLHAAPQAKAAGKGDPAKGKEAFEACGICHNVDSDEKKVGPALKGLYKKKTLQNGKPVSDASVAAQINNGGNGMPAYGDQLSAEEKSNIMAYLHTL